MTYARTLVWLRRDLRLSDHRALMAATRQSKEVALVFCFDRHILDALTDRQDKRLAFIAASLRALDNQLQSHQARLWIRYGFPEQEIPRLAQGLGVQAVFTNHDYEPYARARDEKVRVALSSQKIELHTFKDQVIYEQREILNGQGQPFQVFTSYKNAWLKRLTPADYQPCTPDLSKLWRNDPQLAEPQDWRLEQYGFHSIPSPLEAGERDALARLQSFLPRLNRYHRERDFPALASSSSLSVDLRFGTISIRSLVRAALSHPCEGSQIWLSELIWREFFQMILSEHPRVTKEAYRVAFNHIRWPGTLEEFHAWKAGRTGYPIVDAAMRSFARTGLMHNRLRMIVASFLVKDLLCDWRWGETYFSEKLLDFDLAANNGNWQWCASTGCDAQPYFRIFNPSNQSEKFDPNGTFMREHLPELRNFPTKLLHAPWQASASEQKTAGCVIGKDYPAPLVDHRIQRIRATELYRQHATSENSKAPEE